METLFTQFKVVSVSENTNSFGLHGVIICDKSGLAFEVGIGQMFCPKKDAIISGQVTAAGNLSSLQGITYEIPRKLPSPDAATLVTIFPPERKKRLTDVAKGKKIDTTLDFCKIFGDLDVTKKTAVIKNLDTALETGVSISGKVMPETERGFVHQLRAWCMMNLLVGNELCPPETYINYSKQ